MTELLTANRHYDPSFYSVYDQLRQNALDGDILLVSGSSAVSLAIRAATFSKMSHVASFLWIGNSLFVYEAKEFQGLMLRPASLYVKDRLEDGQNIYFGRAPEIVHKANNIVYDTAMNYRNASYGYPALISVLGAQVLSRYFDDIKVDSDKVVCSILVQRMWEACGHEFPRLMSPGMFVDECQFTTKIRSMSLEPVSEDKTHD